MHLPQTLDRRPSVTLAAVLFFGFGLAIGVMALLPVHPTVCLVGVAILSMVLLNELRVVFLRGKGAVHRLRLLADGRVELGFNDDRWEFCDVRASSFVTRWLVIARLQGDTRAYALVLLPDGLAFDQHRRLRVWLRWCVKPDRVEPADGEGA